MGFLVHLNVQLIFYNLSNSKESELLLSPLLILILAKTLFSRNKKAHCSKDYYNELITSREYKI